MLFTTRRRAVTAALILFAAALVLGHAVTGHAHTDLLTSVPVEDHVPGDAHHETSVGSCELLRAPAGVEAVPTASPAVAGLDPEPGFRLHRLAAVWVPPTGDPPIFLLHAALLI